MFNYRRALTLAVSIFVSDDEAKGHGSLQCSTRLSRTIQSIISRLSKNIGGVKRKTDKGGGGSSGRPRSTMDCSASESKVKLLNANTVLARPRAVPQQERELLFDPDEEIPSNSIHYKRQSTFEKDDHSETQNTVTDKKASGETSCETDITESDTSGHKKQKFMKSQTFENNGEVKEKISHHNGSENFRMEEESAKSTYITGTASEENGIISRRVKGQETYTEGTNAKHNFHIDDDGVTILGSCTIDTFVTHFTRQMSEIIIEIFNTPHTKNTVKTEKSNLTRSDYKTLTKEVNLNRKSSNSQFNGTTKSAQWDGSKHTIKKNTTTVVHENPLAMLNVYHENKSEETILSSTQESDSVNSNKYSKSAEIETIHRKREFNENNSIQGSTFTLIKTLKSRPEKDPFKVVFETKGLEKEDRTEKNEFKKEIKTNKEGSEHVVDVTKNSEVKYAYDTKDNGEYNSGPQITNTSFQVPVDIDVSVSSYIESTDEDTTN